MSSGVALIEGKVKRHDGVRDILVGLLAGQAEIEYYPDLIDPAGVAGLVGAAGFGVPSPSFSSFLLLGHNFGPFPRAPQCLCAFFTVMHVCAVGCGVLYVVRMSSCAVRALIGACNLTSGQAHDAVERRGAGAPIRRRNR